MRRYLRSLLIFWLLTGCQKNPLTAVLITVQHGTEAIRQARVYLRSGTDTCTAPPNQFEAVVGTDANGQALFTGLQTLPYTAWAQGYSFSLKKYVTGKVTFTANTAAGSEYQQVSIPVQ